MGGAAGTEGSTGGQDQWGRVWLRRGLWDSGGGSSVGGHGADCVGGRAAEGLVMVMVIGDNVVDQEGITQTELMRDNADNSEH